MSNTWGMTTERRHDWRDNAACRDIDPELFFPAGIGTEDPQTVEAKAFCKVFCTVRLECLDWALTHGEDWGVWGGTTPAERRGTLRRRTNLAEGKCGNGHPWTAENVRHDKRGGEYCVLCRRGSAAKTNRKLERRRVLAEQFPPINELAQELPGVAPRERRPGRPRAAVMS